ncbi:MAG: patatin-like phospholipase family protein [Bacteroidia bacterium]
MKKIDLELKGGGAHGAFTWGILDRLLDEKELELDGFCGTSAGAMNAVCTSFGMMTGGREGAKNTLEKFWKEVSRVGQTSPLRPSFYDSFVSKGNMDYSPGYKFFSFLSENFSPYQTDLGGVNPLEKLLNSVIDFEILHRQAPPKLFVCATNVRTCEARIFGPKEISSKAIMASACLPYMYKAVEIDGEAYWDGGYMGNPPISPLIEFTEDTNDILLVQVNPIRIKSTPTTIEEIKDRVNEISFNSSLVAEIRQVMFHQELLDKGIDLDGKLKRTRLHNISADNFLHNLNLSSKLNTNWDYLVYLKELGRKAGEEWLNENLQHVGKKTTYVVA